MQITSSFFTSKTRQFYRSCRLRIFHEIVQPSKDRHDDGSSCLAFFLGGRSSTVANDRNCTVGPSCLIIFFSNPSRIALYAFLLIDTGWLFDMIRDFDLELHLTGDTWGPCVVEDLVFPFEFEAARADLLLDFSLAFLLLAPDFTCCNLAIDLVAFFLFSNSGFQCPSDSTQSLRGIGLPSGVRNRLLS